MELPRESPFPTHRGRRMTFVVNKDTYSAVIVTEQNTVICQSKQDHYLPISRLWQMAILLKSSSIIIVLFHKFRLLCYNLFFYVRGGGGGRMAGNVRPTVKLHTSRAQQDIKTGT